VVTVAIGILSLAAILGLVLLSFVLRKKETPKAVVIGHGLLAVTAVILLIIYSVGPGPGPTESIILFLIAATGGLILVSRDFIGKTIPRWLAVAHGLIAITAFVLLLAFRF
jgi:hypothetical protein